MILEVEFQRADGDRCVAIGLFLLGSAVVSCWLWWVSTDKSKPAGRGPPAALLFVQANKK